MYENLLFWRFFSSNITHNFQKLIEAEDSYVKGVNYTLKKFNKYDELLNLTESECSKYLKKSLLSTSSKIVDTKNITII